MRHCVNASNRIQSRNEYRVEKLSRKCLLAGECWEKSAMRTKIGLRGSPIKKITISIKTVLPGSPDNGEVIG